MIRQNEWKLLVSSLIIVSPILAGVLLWDQLPDSMVTHWGIEGQPDGWSTKSVAILSIPMILLVAHWFCLYMTSLDRKNTKQSSKVFNMIFWIMPVTSLFTNTIMYRVALGKHLNIKLFVFLLLGITFIWIGNYLPKCKQNYTIGIKVKWTLENEENWNATHRFAGKLWVACGILLLLGCVIPTEGIMIALMMITILVAGIIPMVYSYQYHKKQVALGTAAITPIQVSTKNKVFSTIMILVSCLGIGWILFTGDIDIVYEDTTFTIQADFYTDLTVAYEQIETIEYITEDTPGTRTMGFGSPRLFMGTFENEEYGNYTRYSYAGCKSAVVLKNHGSVLVINGIDEKSTQEIYETLIERIEQ